VICLRIGTQHQCQQVLYANDAVRPHDSTGTFQHVAFDIIVDVRDHRAVQAEQHTVER